MSKTTKIISDKPNKRQIFYGWFVLSKNVYLHMILVGTIFKRATQYPNT